MVRTAQLSDIQNICNIVRVFQRDPVAPEYFRRAGEETLHAERMIIDCIQSGLTLVSEQDGSLTGVIIGYRTPVPFYANVYMAEEFIWYVLPEYRNTSAGYRLFKAWVETVETMLEQKQIITAVCHTLADSPVDMSRHGFRVLQTSYYRE